MSSNAANVGLATDGPGKKVRTMEVTILQGDGTLATVEMQVVSIADSNGKVLDFSGLEGLLERLNDNIEELLFETQLQNETDKE